MKESAAWKQVCERFLITELANPMLEQTLYFLILSCFFMMISCYKLVVQQDQNAFLFKKFKESIEFGHIFWKFMFFILKNIQTIVLIKLFISGAQNFNTLEHLCYIIFFVAFTANIELYRKGAGLLIFFVSILIFI